MKRISVLLLVLLFSGSMLLALDPLYERNGTAFLLVSDENFTQDPLDGVYQINRTSSGIPEKLFYPSLTYGIGVNLNLHLNTFSEQKDNAPSSYTGLQQKVVNYMQTSGYYTGKAWWHRCINQINGSSRIAGSEKHFPCEAHLHAAGSYSIVNNAVNGDSGFKLMKIPSGYWYHSSTPAALGWPAPGGWFAVNETTPSAHINPNPYFSTARSWKMYKDDEMRLAHKYYKHTWKPGDGPGTPPQGPKVAESFDVDITRSIKNGCFDSCGIDVSSVPLPADKWITSMVFNRLSSSYFYARKDGGTEAYIDIDGTRHTTYPVIGSMNLTDSLHIGVSMKSATDDYVYVLGKTVIEAWLKSYYGYSVQVDYAAATVSDQWWMKGGSVFIYDRTAGRIYQIERDEGLPTVPSDPYDSNKIDKIVIHSGIGTDLNALSSDGFGNFFYTKSNSVPAQAKDFAFTDKTGVTWGSVSGAIRPGKVHYRQNIYKTVFKKAIDGTNSEEGNLLIGYKKYDQNIQYTPYTPTSNLNDTNKWVKMGTGIPYEVYSSIGNVSRTELATVNVATPPNVSGEKIAKIDINGPFTDSGDNTYSVPENAASLTPTMTYKFEVENYPLHNGKINQRVKTDTEIDAKFRRIDRHSGIVGSTNNFIGGFVSTLKILGADSSETVKYTWKAYQTMDEHATAVSPRALIYSKGVSSPYYKPYVFASFDTGEYDIEVSVSYKWYDTDQLPYGSTVADLPGTIQTGNSVAKDLTSTVAKMHIVVGTGLPIPPNVGNIRIRRYNNVSNSWVESDKTEIAPYGDYFVTDENLTESWQVDGHDSSGPNSFIEQIRGDTPPSPGDPNMKPNSLAWVDASVIAHWSVRILDPVTLTWGDYYDPPGLNETIGSSKQQTIGQIDPNIPSSNNNKFNLQTGISLALSNDNWPTAFKIPSDPTLCELRCNMKRAMEWINLPMGTEVGPNGNLITLPTGEEIPMSKNIELTGIVKVLVRDTSPPEIVTATSSHEFLYAETLGYIKNSVDGKNINPDEIVVYVKDNNPMAFLNKVRPTVGKHSIGSPFAKMSYQARSSTSLSAIDDHSIDISSSDIVISPDELGTIYELTIHKNRFSAQMPQHKAIHINDYSAITAANTIDASNLIMDNLNYGIATIEDSSGNSVSGSPYEDLGDILLIDTTRPNIVLSIHDEKYDFTRYAPNSKTFGEHADFTYVNNTLKWDGSVPSNLGNINIGGTAITSMLANFQTHVDKPIEVDTPITFVLNGIDNVTEDGAVHLDSFQIKQIQPSNLNAEDISMPIHRRLFRMDDGGAQQVWQLKGEIRDQSVGLGSTFNYQDPYSPSAIYIKKDRIRILENVPFTVHNTVLDVRVIDKKQH